MGLACGSFDTAGSGSGPPAADAAAAGDDGGAPASDDAQASPNAATFLGTSFKSAFSGGSISVVAPATVAAGDVVLALWGVADYHQPPDPPGWTQLGTGPMGNDGAVQGYAWVGYHVMEAGESDTTAFTFSHGDGTSGMQLALVAYRTPRPTKPIRLAIVNVSEVAQTGAGPYDAVHAFPPLDPVLGSPVATFVMTAAATTFPSVPGMTGTTLSQAIGFYRRASAASENLFQAESVTLRSNESAIRKVVTGAIAFTN